MPVVLRFIEPCLPSPGDPSGSNWIHEIKHDGYRLMARRDPVGIRLLTRRANGWTTRFPLVVEAINHLKVRSCLIDGRSGVLRRARLGDVFTFYVGAKTRRTLFCSPLTCWNSTASISGENRSKRARRR
jgi:hypothetical protein